jgi:hypothetical protein
MRVGMTYYGVFGSGEIPAACGAFGYGEFEDYCLTIQSANDVSTLNISSMQVFPNPNKGNFVITDVVAGTKMVIWDMQGRVVHQDIIAGTGTYECNINLPSGVYGITLGDNRGGKKLKMIVQ